MSLKRTLPALSLDKTLTTFRATIINQRINVDSSLSSMFFTLNFYFPVFILTGRTFKCSFVRSTGCIDITIYAVPALKRAAISNRFINKSRHTNLLLRKTDDADKGALVIFVILFYDYGFRYHKSACVGIFIGGEMFTLAPFTNVNSRVSIKEFKSFLKERFAPMIKAVANFP